MLNISNCKDYLEGYYFTNVKFIKENKGNLYFSAIDEDDTLSYIEFEPVGEVVFVNVKYSENEPYMVFEKLQH